MRRQDGRPPIESPGLFPRRGSEGRAPGSAPLGPDAAACPRTAGTLGALCRGRCKPRASEACRRRAAARRDGCPLGGQRLRRF